MSRTAKGTLRKDALANIRLDQLGLDPLEEVVQALRFNKEMTLKGGNFDNQGKTDQAQFAALWLKAALDLARFKYPVLSAVAVKDLAGTEQSKEPLTTSQAIDVIKSDPFAPKEIKEIPTDRIVEAMNSQLNAPFLPSGEKKP